MNVIEWFRLERLDKMEGAMNVVWKTTTLIFLQVDCTGLSRDSAFSYSIEQGVELSPLCSNFSGVLILRVVT